MQETWSGGDGAAGKDFSGEEGVFKDLGEREKKVAVEKAVIEAEAGKDWEKIE